MLNVNKAFIFIDRIKFINDRDLIMKYLNNKKNVYDNLILINLKLLILGTSLFVYKSVYDFRINQEASFKLFAILLFSLWILKILHNEEYSFEKTNLNLPIFIFILFSHLFFNYK